MDSSSSQALPAVDPALEEIVSSSVMADAGLGQAQLRLVGTTLAQQGQHQIASSYVL